MFYRTAYCLILMLFAGIAQAEAMLSAIRFEGNDVTQEVVMLREMTIQVGDEVESGKIEESVRNIMNLGLFERVTYRTEAIDGTDDFVLVVIVLERYYLIPLPTAKLNDDSELEYGLKLRWNNIWGKNHSLRWTLKNKGSDFGVREYENKIEYQMPRIYSSRYELTFNMSNEVNADDDPLNGQQQQRSSVLGFDALKWLGEQNVSRGLFVRGGVNYIRKKILFLSIPNTAEQDFDAVIYSAGMGYNAISEREFNREGYFVQYKLDTSPDDKPGFNKPFVKHEINYTYLHSLNRLPPVNFNYNMAIGSSDNDVLGDKAFSLGGNTNLRGYKTAAFRGNAVMRINFEYLTAFKGSPTLRKVLFVDLGDAQETLGDISFSTIKTGAGGGIRWKLRRFVDLDIRVDLAYGFETDEFRLGLGTHSTF